MKKLLFLPAIAAGLLLDSCWFNTSGRIFDNAGHKAVSDVAALKTGDKLYCRNGEYFLCLPRYRAESKPKLMYGGGWFHFPSDLEEEEDMGDVRYQMFRIPPEFASYICGGEGTPTPAYMDPVWDLTRLHGAQGRAITRRAPGIEASFVDKSGTDPNGARNQECICDTADIRIGGVVMVNNGSYYISLPIYPKRQTPATKPSGSFGGKEGEQWFRIPEDYATYLMGGTGPDKPSSMTPVKGALAFSPAEERTIKRQPASCKEVYDYSSPNAALLYVGGALDALVVDVPVSAVTTTLLMVAQIGVFWLEGELDDEDDDHHGVKMKFHNNSAKPKQSPTLAAPSMGDLNAR